MAELSTPTGREEELRAVPRADGTAPRALVLGATGYIGGRLVPRLVAAGYRVRVLVRDPARLAAFDWADAVDVVAGTATDAAALETACADVDVLYYLIHSMGEGAGFERADLTAARAVAAAASAASVGRVVSLGSWPQAGDERDHEVSEPPRGRGDDNGDDQQPAGKDGAVVAVRDGRRGRDLGR